MNLYEKKLNIVCKKLSTLVKSGADDLHIKSELMQLACLMGVDVADLLDAIEDVDPGLVRDIETKLNADEIM